MKKAYGTLVAMVLVGGGMWPAMAQDSDRFEVVAGATGVTVHVDGRLFAQYVVGESNKPYLYPVLGPTGALMTRSYPMEDVEGERKDHPHHRSIWFGHQSVGGFDTWHEPKTIEERAAQKKDAKEQDKVRAEGLAGLGATVHREFVKLIADRDRAIIVTRNDYVDSTGKKLMADERTHTFRAPDENTRMIDVDIVFSAPYGPVVLGDKKDAGFSVRVPTVLDVDSNQGGVLITSKGDEGKDAWGKRADWCDYSGVVKGQKVGIAMLNHPKSWRYPTPWHARMYGLLTANPFGLQSVAEEGESGEYELRAPATITLRHRIIFHVGDAKEAGVQRAWEAYAAE